MKKFVIYFILISFVLGCSKNEDATCVTMVEVEGSYFGMSGKGIIKIDRDKKILEITSNQDSILTAMKINVKNSEIAVNTKYWGVWKYTLDGRQRTSKVEMHDGVMQFDFAYNSQNQISTGKKKEYNFESSLEFFYNAGNLIKIIEKHPAQYSETVYEFKYDSKVYVPLVSVTEPLHYLGFIQPLPGCFGVQNKNRLISVNTIGKSTYSGSFGQVIHQQSYELTYIDNKEGNVETLNIKNQSYNSINEGRYDFKYSCN